MTDTTAVQVALAAAAGVLIGLLYFGVLWWTVRRIVSARSPALLAMASFLIRTVVAAASLVAVARGNPLLLLAAVAGFLVGRTILVRTVGAPLRAGIEVRTEP